MGAAWIHADLGRLFAKLGPKGTQARDTRGTLAKGSPPCGILWHPVASHDRSGWLGSRWWRFRGWACSELACRRPSFAAKLGRKPRALVSPDSIIPTCWNPGNQDCIVCSWVPGIVCIQEPSESLLGKSFHVPLSHPFLTSQWLWASLGHWEDNICLKPQQMIRCLLAGSPSLRARSASCLLWTSEDSPLPFPWSKWLYAPDGSIMVHQGTNAQNPIIRIQKKHVSTISKWKKFWMASYCLGSQNCTGDDDTSSGSCQRWHQATCSAQCQARIVGWVQNGAHTLINSTEWFILRFKRRSEHYKWPKLYLFGHIWALFCSLFVFETCPEVKFRA